MAALKKHMASVNPRGRDAVKQEEDEEAPLEDANINPIDTEAGEDQAPLIRNIFDLFANNDFCEVD